MAPFPKGTLDQLHRILGTSALAVTVTHSLRRYSHTVQLTSSKLPRTLPMTYIASSRAPLSHPHTARFSACVTFLPKAYVASSGSPPCRPRAGWFSSSQFRYYAGFPCRSLLLLSNFTAKTAAPKPLSMLTTDTPGAQALSIVKSGARPDMAAP